MRQLSRVGEMVLVAVWYEVIKQPGNVVAFVLATLYPEVVTPGQFHEILHDHYGRRYVVGETLIPLETEAVGVFLVKVERGFIGRGTKLEACLGPNRGVYWYPRPVEGWLLDSSWWGTFQYRG